MSKTGRNPLLGYNHNVRYAGRIFHVQTEDSGPANPHLITHLFYGGTILATHRHEYDTALDEAEVRRLMQAQHKLILKELKSAAHDAKIAQFFAGRSEAAMPPVAEDSVPAEGPGSGITSALDLDAVEPPTGPHAIDDTHPASPPSPSEFVHKGGSKERITFGDARKPKPPDPTPPPLTPLIVRLQPTPPPTVAARRRKTPIALRWLASVFGKRPPPPRPPPAREPGAPVAQMPNIDSSDIDTVLDEFLSTVSGTHRKDP